jgi:hypothetical protein
MRNGSAGDAPAANALRQASANCRLEVLTSASFSAAASSPGAVQQGGSRQAFLCGRSHQRGDLVRRVNALVGRSPGWWWVRA